jgi:hypothetical protein
MLDGIRQGETNVAKQEVVKIKAPDLRIASFKIRSTSEFVQNAFSRRQQDKIEATQREGSQSTKRKTKTPKDFEQNFRESQHRAKQGWYGVPCSAYRSALIRACSLVGFKMTIAKMSAWVLADGHDAADGTPLVKMKCKPPQMKIMPCRNANGGMDLRARAHYDAYEAVVRIQYDNDQFSITDLANLLVRAGAQVGVGEGRNDSPNSNGMGWGSFELVQKGKKAK